MTITSFDIYVITRLDAFRMCIDAVTSAYVAMVVVYLIAAVVKAFNVDEPLSTKRCDTLMGYIRKAKPYVYLPILFALTVFVPSTKEMAAIKVIPAIANSETVQDKIPEALNGLVDLATDWMKELSPKKEEACNETTRRN